MGLLPQFCILLTEVTEAGEESSPLLRVVASVVPWVVVLAFIWLFVFRQFRGAKKTQDRAMEQIDRSFEHMERSEVQQERMITLLEQLNDKLDRLR